MVGLARLAGLEDEADPRARARPHEVVVDRRDGEERRDRARRVSSWPRSDRMIRLWPSAIASDARWRTSSIARRRPCPFSETRNRIGSVIERKPRDAGPAVERADLLELRVREDRRRERELEGRPRPGLQQVVLRPDRRLGRHDDLFADRVHRRVRDLREELLEVAVEQLRPLREHGERRVVAHRADRVGARGRHRVDDQADVLGRVAEDLLAPQDGLVVGLDDAGAGAGRSSMRTSHCRFHSPYGCAAATASFSSSSETIRPSAVSTRNMRPGWRRPLADDLGRAGCRARRPPRP